MHKKKNVLSEPAPGNQLPEVLQNRAFKFVLIIKGEKRPCEKNWPNTNNYHYDDPKLLRHLKSGGNYGVLCGPGGLVVVDVDNPQWIENIRAALPETCTVKTGGGGYHFYFIVKGYGGKTILYDPDTGDHIGEVQSGKMTKGEQRTQVVGPGSLHPSGTRYLIANDGNIAKITAQALKDTLLSCGVVFERTKNDRIPRETLKQSIATRHVEHDAGVDTLRIEDVVDLSGFKELKPGVYQGPHPVHGSETGHNLVIDTNQNLWHCFRCNTGGTPFQFFAAQEGILDCSQCVPGVLRGDFFKQVKNRALECGLIKTTMSIPKPTTINEDDDLTGWVITNIRDQCEQGKRAIARTIFTNYLLDTEYFITDENSNEIYRYRDGVYVREGAEAFIKRTYGDMFPAQYQTTYHEREIIAFLKRKTLHSPTEFDADSYKLCLGNGILDLEPLTTGGDPELLPHDPKYYVTLKLPVIYDKSANNERFEQFLTEITDKNTPQDTETLKKAIGFVLWPRYHPHKAFMLVGEGSNGKGTLLYVIGELVGEEAVACVTLKDLERDRFAGADLDGKMVNLVDDLSKTELKETGAFKSLTGEGKIRVQRKYGHAFNTENRAKMFYNANRVPPTHDDSDGFFRRWEVVNFPNRFLGTNEDENLKETLTTPEGLSGVLNVAIDGLTALLKDKAFSDKTIDDIRLYFERTSDPVGCFIDDCCDVIEYEVNDYGRLELPELVEPIEKREVYKLFRKYCKKHRIPLVPENKFHPNLKAAEPGLRETRGNPAKNGRRPHIYKNLIVFDVEEML